MNISEKITEQKALTEELCLASKAYYDGEPIMSDIEFDKKLDKLKEMEKESKKVLSNSPTVNVGAVSVTTLKKVRHEYPALSLDKIKYKDREDLLEWLGHKRAVMSWKCDGSSVMLTYDDGSLTSAVTRGDGEEGSDITHNARFFKGVPISIPVMGHIVVRGEAMMSNKEFERINTEAGGIYENARNLATATIQMLDSNESRKREIIFKAFELVTPGVDAYDYDMGSETLYDLSEMAGRLAWLESLGFDVVDRTYCTEDNILSKIEEYKEKVKDLPYPTDGLVISYDDLKYGWALGSTGHHPRWAIALKWTDETVTTTVREIEWSVGSTGLITPVAVFDEVRLGLGSNVTRASLHNLSIMKRLGIKKNCKAEVYLANLIIPQIASCEGGDEEFEQPTKCPICGKPTAMFISPAKVEILKCVNEKCGAQQIGKLMNTFSKDGLFVKGLGESQIENLLNTGFVTAHPISFYYMANSYNYKNELPVENNFIERLSELFERDGWGQKKWDNLIEAINASRKTTLQKFLYSLNIPLCGNDLSKKLAKFWNNDINCFIDFIRQFAASDEVESNDDKAFMEGIHEWGYRELAGIDGVGNEKAKNIINWIEEITAYRERYEDFICYIEELDFQNTNESADESLKGLTFVITGVVNIYKNRDEFKASVEARGGKVTGSVSKNTTALVNNDVTSTSGKNQKAKELDIEIISEDEFISRYGK